MWSSHLAASAAGATIAAPTVSGVIVQDFEETRSASDTVELMDETGEVVALAIQDQERATGTINYAYLGADAAALGAAVTVTGYTAPGAVFVTELSTKASNKEYKSGSCKFISIDGIDS